MKTFSWAGLLSLILLISTGCRGVRPHNVHVKPMTGASVEVDLIGVTRTELEDWESYPIDKYWQPNDAMRRNADKFTVKIVNNTATPTQLPLSDAIWGRWMQRRATHLVVIANLPGSFTTSPDPRRKILSLDQRDWDTKKPDLEIEILDNRIRIATPSRER